MSIDERTCTICQNPFPATAEFFHRKQSGELRGECKACRHKKSKEKAEREKDSRLDDIEKGAIEHFVIAARQGGGNVPHTRELLEVGMNYFGGVQGFMNIFMKNLYDAPSGGAYRTKMLMAWLGLVTANTSLGGATKPLEVMTEDELQEEIRKGFLLESARMKMGVVVEGRSLPMPDALPTPKELERGETPKIDAPADDS